MDELSGDESERLATLYGLRILDTAPEQIYDDVVTLAAQICDVPIAIINFVDAERQWGKALVGLKSSEAPREASFCARTIQQVGGVLIVPDTHADPVWADNPQVTGAPGLKFYAGAAIATAEGHALGSVCVADDRMPRQLDGRQIEALRVLARQTASHLELRRYVADLGRANEKLHPTARTFSRPSVWSCAGGMGVTPGCCSATWIASSGSMTATDTTSVMSCFG
jgi:GAF domain-containing protein